MSEVAFPLSSAFMLHGAGMVSIVGAGGKTTLMFRLARELSEAGSTVLTTTTTKVMMPSRDQAAVVIVAEDVGEVLERASSVKDPHIFAASGPSGHEGKLSGFAPQAVEALWKSGLFRWVLVEADGAARRPLKAPASHEPVIPEGSAWVIAVAGMDAIGRPLDDDSVFRPRLYSEITGLGEGEPITEESIALSLVHPRGVMRGSPPGAIRCLFLNKAEDPRGLQAARRIVGFLSHVKDKGPMRVVIGGASGEHPVMETHDL